VIYLVSHAPTTNLNRVYPPDLTRPLLAYRYGGDALCGQVVVPFRCEGACHSVDAFIDLHHDVRDVHVIPTPRDERAALAVWVEAEAAVRDLADRSREKGESDAVRLYTLAADAIEERVHTLGRRLYDIRPSRHYGTSS